jgi:hypothetical protein
MEVIFIFVGGTTIRGEISNEGAHNILINDLNSKEQFINLANFTFNKSHLIYVGNI